MQNENKPNFMYDFIFDENKQALFFKKNEEILYSYLCFFENKTQYFVQCLYNVTNIVQLID
jgi:hypothetical protein